MKLRRQHSGLFKEKLAATQKPHSAPGNPLYPVDHSGKIVWRLFKERLIYEQSAARTVREQQGKRSFG
jgi:hypothetical protein